VKAARIHSFGPPDVVVVEDVPVPSPGPGEVLVRVMAAGVAPWDAIIREGKSKVSPQPPLTLGSDFSGVVDKVGPGVTDVAPADEVYASPTRSSVAHRLSSPWQRPGWSPANRNR
jgi:NADPH:quinone reductase-like Zn-dependent oxidoreductase